jgi:phospholipase D1/2
VGANGSDFEDRCSLITVAFNELMEHKDGHGALLIEVQERASPASSESLDEPTRERTSNIPGEDLAAAKFTQGVVEDVPVREEDTATTTTNNTTSSSTVASANHPHLPHDPQSQALDSSPNAQFQPLRKVQRAMSAAYLRSAATLKKADVEELEEMSYFDAEEIRELHILFSKVAGYTSHITPESFSAFLPELSDPQLRRAVFAGFDKSRTFDQKISFDEFVLSLSSMCRGTLEERAVVVFNMCSSSQASQVTATVSREQVLAVVSRIAAAMEQAGFTPRDYGNPIQVVNNVFLKSGEAPKNDRAAGPRRMREKIAHLAKGLAHHHRDESITNRGQAEAYSRERYELDDDDESSSIDDSQGSTDSDSDVPDGPNVAAPSSPHNERVLPHRKMSRLTFYRKDTSKAEKPAKPPKPESSAIPPASHMSILEDTSSAPTTPSTTPTPKGAHSVENSQASDIPASPSNKATLQHAANASSAQPHGASLSTSDDDSSPVSVANKSPEKPETTSKSIDLLQPEDAIKEAKEQIEPPLIHSKSSSSSKKVRDEDVTESSSSRLKRVMFDASSSAESDGGLGEGSRSDSDKEETSMPPRKAKTALSPAGLKPSLRPAPHPSGSPVPSRRAGAQHKVVSVARYEDGLTKKQFKVRCRNEPDLPECFGLFDFFNSAVVEPVAKTSAERSIWHRVSVSGFMGKERGSMSRKIGKVKDKRHFVLKDGFLGYSKKPGGPLLRAIAIQEASIKPHISEKKFALTVIAPYFHRKLFLQSAQEAQIWVHAMRSMIKGKNRFKSFALPRKNIAVRPFMNGKEYFDALVPALLKCKRRLYISGWYLSPGLLLKRGAMGAIDRFRLDNLILEAANRGVSIFIIIYNAPSFSDFDLQPSYVCNFFNNLHPNIHALMHPNYYVPSMWSHHQKLVVCDESLAFIGGIDLCYGRYEDSDYNITDPEETNFPGRDYCNVFLENESNGPSEQALIDRTVQPRMPWSDVQVQLSGMAAFDVGLNFLHRWNHILREGTYECKPLPFLFPSHSVFDEEQKIGTIDASTGQPFPTVPVQETPAMETRRLRSSSRGTNGAPSPANSAPNSSRAPTSPTSASSAATTGPTDTNAVPLNKDEPIVPPDMLPQDIMPPEEAEDVLSGGLPDDMIAIPELPWDSRVPIENISLPAEDLGYHGCTVQIVRSVCGWSAGTSAPEQSIYKAYLSLIRESQHFIFIQNQYFISSIETSSPKNRIAEAIYLRLREAIEQKQVFRVLVLIPVLPGGGAIEAASTRYMLKYTNRTISRGGNSILEKLQQDFPDVDVHEYIRFGTPRQIGRLGDTLLSEPVYIHSKVMIVDDRRAIIGSANINDRSLRGTRDSEVACVIEPGTKESTSKSTFNGHSVEVCKAVQSLRVRMFADMIGTKVHSNKPEDIETMMNLQDAHTAVDLLMRRAELNTKAYLRVFPGMIPNVIYKISDFKRARVDVGPKEDPVVRDQRFEDMSLIRGIITSWPYDFLKEEPMGISLFEKEYVVPRIVFL